MNFRTFFVYTMWWTNMPLQSCVLSRPQLVINKDCNSSLLYWQVGNAPGVDWPDCPKKGAYKTGVMAASLHSLAVAKGHNLPEGPKAICSHKPPQLAMAKDHKTWKLLPWHNLVTLRENKQHSNAYALGIDNVSVLRLYTSMPGKLIDYLNPPLINPNTLMSIGYYAESTVPISTSKSIQVHVSQVTQVTLFLILFLNILSS